MADTAAVLHDYLMSRFGITLERVLADAAAGVETLALHGGDDANGSVSIACDPVGRHEYDDEGVSDQFQGLIAVEGVTYRCHFVIFTDGGGGVASFNHRIRPRQQRRRDGKAERLGRVEVDYHLELVRLHDR